MSDIMDKKTEAKIFRKKGLTYKQIGDIFGVSWSTARRWISKEAYDYDYNRRNENGVPRIIQLLGISRCSAKKGGHSPCTTPAEIIAKTFTDTCQMCGAKEIEVGRLKLDHDHKTGKFRGWLCDNCNKSLGHYEKIKDLAERYLNESS